MSPKVSIIVPFFNVAEFVEQCARSLFEQTLQDIEIIFVNDCTPDNSEELILNTLEQYPHRKSQVKILRHSQNKGLPQARKTGCLAAQGEYVLNVDSDDFVEPTMAESMYDKVSREDADIAICDYYFHENHEDRVGVDEYHDIGPNGINRINAMLSRKECSVIWCRMFRRSLFLHPDFVWAEHNMYEDVLMVSELYILASKLVYVPECLYHYRFNNQSIARKSDTAACVKRFEGAYANVNALLKFMKEKGVYEQYEGGNILLMMEVRNFLGPLLGQHKYRKLWLKTYPELNRIMFLGNDLYPSSFQNKLWFLAVCLGLYPRFSYILLCKMLRPTSVWSAALERKMRSTK